MVNYRYDLKPLARNLRKNMTDAEEKLWFQIRRKQILGVQFYRQRPIGQYITDFYAPTQKLVIELDGSQHLEGEAMQLDMQRTAFLESIGISVVRFNNMAVFNNMTGVLEMIHGFISEGKASPVFHTNRDSYDKALQ